MTPRSHHGKMLDFVTTRIHRLEKVLDADMCKNSPHLLMIVEDSLKFWKDEKKRLIKLTQTEASTRRQSPIAGSAS